VETQGTQKAVPPIFSGFSGKARSGWHLSTRGVSREAGRRYNIIIFYHFTMNYDYFLPLLLFVCVAVAALWLYSSLDIAGGWTGVFTFLLLLLGVRVDLLHRQHEKARSEHRENVEWMENEVRRVYRGLSDPSGEVFVRYSNLFAMAANARQEKLEAFERKLEKLSARRPVSGLRMPDLLRRLDIDMAYNSNAIEGNPISLSETTLILAGYVGGRRKSLRHVNDIVGHHKAFEELKAMVSRTSQLSMEQLLILHKLVLYESDDGGVLRSGEEVAMVSGKKVLFAMPDETENLVKKLLSWASKKSETMHPFLHAVTFHYIFVRIHPFRDGNGRTARLLFNFILMRAGYPLIILPFKRKASYMAALDEWDKGNPETLTAFMGNCLDDSFAQYFSALNIT
jgi:fido (protein-threonine AMPylation protein)